MKIKVGLIDLDKSDKFPNLALMKVSSFYKGKNCIVEWYNPIFGGKYDIVYVSKVFKESPDYSYHINSEKIVYGGVGHNLEINLPEEIELSFPDYKIYSFVGENKAYGFLTRGCPRQCNL